MDTEEIIAKITDRTVVVFTHVQGFNGLDKKLLKILEQKQFS